MNSSIDIIIGPMYSGKTTELIRLLNIYSEIGLKVLYVNSALDNRDGDAAFSTHNPVLEVNKSKIDCIKTININDIAMKCNLYDVIGVNLSCLSCFFVVASVCFFVFNTRLFRLFSPPFCILPSSIFSPYSFTTIPVFFLISVRT